MDAFVYGGLIYSFIAIIMVDILADAFIPVQNYLIPSQVIHSPSNRRLGQPPATTARQQPLTDKVACQASVSSITPPSCNGTETTSTTADTDHATRRSRQRRKRPKKQRPPKHQTTTPPFPLEGNLPDVFWRAIAMEHLREHPFFIKLPPVVERLDTLEDARRFRQDSFQWDLLHQGRCTTSQAVVALGFLEQEAATQLGIPNAWRRGGRGAFQRLRETPLRTVSEMEATLCTDESPPPLGIDGKSLWKPSRKRNEVATHDYVYKLSDSELQERKEQARKFAKNDQLAMSIRMMWGNTQEATALLVALNYFAKNDPGFRLEEVGMCGAGAELNRQTFHSGLLVGASPDGVLRHSNGTIEALEVKNHCPFFTTLYKTKKSKHRKRFSVSSLPRGVDINNGGVFSHYVPQLQMEMLCVGPECRSAVMVRLTARGGALLLRMKRDDEWIAEMLYWLNRFQTDFVQANKPPPKDFFWNASNRSQRSRYRRFINKTMEVRKNNVEVIGAIPSRDIQRGDPSPLFLD